LRKPTVLVIGAGIGGIATAAHLARSGFAVTVIEKQRGPGGRCGRLSIDGHRFDTGPTLYLMPEIYSRTFSDLGARIEDHLDLRRVDPTYRINFADGSALSLSSDLLAMQAQLEAFEPGSFAGFLRYLELAGTHYKFAMPQLVERDFRHLWEFANPRTLGMLLKLKALRRHYASMASYFADPRLKAAFTFQDMYMGLSPFEAPSLYSLLQYTELTEGVWLPIGGMYRIVEALAALAEQLGVKFSYGSPVEQVEVDENRTTGVRLSSGERIPAEVIVANADLSYVYRRLLPQDGSARRLERMKYGCSAMVFYWGLARRYSELGVHNLFLAQDYRRSFDPIFQELTLPDEPSFYVHAPARLDPAAAPASGDSLMVALPVGHLNEHTPQDWNELQERARGHVIHRLRQFGLDDLEQHIVVEHRAMPHDWQSRFNLTKGSTHGLSHDLTQMGYLRPRNRHSRYRNLYFVGASTHPGTGIPTVLISARLAAERIREEVPLPYAAAAVAPALPS
jgi:phytoene desaturase